MDQKKDTIDPRSGFNSVTKTFQSLRPPLHLPSQQLPLSVSAYAFSLLRNCPSWLDSLALIDSATGHRIFYSEFFRRTQTLASNLQTLIGLSKGDTAFVLSPNSVQVPILYFALLTLGVVIAPVNPASTESGIARLVQLCKPVVAFALSSTAHLLQSHNFARIILIDSPEFDSLTTSDTTGHLDDSVQVSQSDLAVVLHSSGTTGRVKGVMLTHRNLIAMLASFNAQRSRVKKNKPSPAVVLCTVPFCHVYGFGCCTNSVALGNVVAVMESFDLRRVLRAIEEFEVNNLALYPADLAALANSSTELTAAYNLSSWTSVVCGGSHLKKDVITAFKDRFPNVTLIQGYGITEVPGTVARQENPEEFLRFDSAGRITEGLEVKIVDLETGVALPPLKQGEILVRGPSVMKGYIGDEEATMAPALVEDGWLRTGDICYIDKEGFVYLVDRLKDLINYKGYQVAPTELEELLQSHPDIFDAAVIPYPDNEAGEVPMAIVVRKPQSNIVESEVIDFMAEQVVPYKKIGRVAFVDTIPKTFGGKVLRKELRKLFIPAGTLS